MSLMPGNQWTKPSRTLTLTFDRDLSEAIWQYHTSLGLDDKVQETVKTLCRMALAADPASGAMHGAAYRAWNETRRWAMTALGDKLVELQDVLSETLRGMDASASDSEKKKGG